MTGSVTLHSAAKFLNEVARSQPTRFFSSIKERVSTFFQDILSLLGQIRLFSASTEKSLKERAVKVQVPPIREDLIESNPDLRNFKTYFENHCGRVEGSVSFDQAVHFVNEGRKLLATITSQNNIDENFGPKNEADAQKKISQLIWFMTYAAVIDDGQGFTSGTFCLKNPKVLAYFKKYTYSRLSSHYEGRSSKHYGIDVPRSSPYALPVKKTTVLLGEFKIPGQETPGLYMKMEDWGCKNLKDSIFHTWDWFKGGSASVLNRKERVPKGLKKSFRELTKEIKKNNLPIHYSAKKIEQYGFVAIKHAVSVIRKSLKDIENLPSDLESEPKSSKYSISNLKRNAKNVDLKKLTAVDHELEKLHHRSDLDIRTGDEVFIETDASKLLTGQTWRALEMRIQNPFLLDLEAFERKPWDFGP